VNVVVQAVRTLVVLYGSTMHKDTVAYLQTDFRYMKFNKFYNISNTQSGMTNSESTKIYLV